MDWEGIAGANEMMVSDYGRAWSVFYRRRKYYPNIFKISVINKTSLKTLRAPLPSGFSQNAVIHYRRPAGNRRAIYRAYEREFKGE